MRKYTKEWLEELCKDSYSYAEVLTKAGRKNGGGSQATLKKKISEFNIDISHFTGQRWQWSPNNKDLHVNREKYNLNEVFIKNSLVTQKVLRGYVERHNILEYKCENCGCDGHWQNGLIALEIDHIDGDNTNNEISNLRYLCPNCHALTETYRGRNIALKNKCVETTHQPPKS
jgi:Zn finger protein HypA/HybF involved in hydrogenase expression